MIQRFFTGSILAVLMSAWLGTSASAQHLNPSPFESKKDDPTLAQLLDAIGFAKVKPNEKQETYRVTVESGSDTVVVVCSERAASWNYNDEKPVTYVHMWALASEWYGDKTECPAELTQFLAEMNGHSNWVDFSIVRDENAHSWVVLIEADYFLRGGDPEVLSTYLQLVANTVVANKPKFAAIVESGVSK
jgi:hypothetical protein